MVMPGDYRHICETDTDIVDARIARSVSIAGMRATRALAIYWQIVRGLCITLVLITVIAGCESKHTVVNVIPSLSMPGMTSLPALTQVEQRAHSNVVLSMTTYRVMGQQESLHFLFEMGPGVYDVDASGSNVRLLSTDSHCDGELAVLGNASVAACRTDDGIELFRVPSAPNSRSNQLLPNPAGGHFTGLAFSPSGDYLATIVGTADECAIVAYHLPVGTNPIATGNPLVLPNMLGSGSAGCGTFTLSWSPDGAWLAYIEASAPTHGSIYLVPAQLLLAASQSSAASSTQVTQHQVQYIADTGSVESVSWSHDSKSVLYVGSDQWSIVSQPLATGTATTVVTQHNARMCNTMWDPDGMSILFVICRVGGDLAPPPSALYSYTPETP